MNAPQNPKLHPGTVILCWFPYKDRPYGPGDDLRPCLVVDPCVPTPDGDLVRVAYGGCLLKTRNSGADLCIVSKLDVQRCGLRKPTRFSLRRVELIPINTRFIDMTKGYVLGSLPPKRRREFEARMVQAGLRQRGIR